jgi:hypothetical protein
MLSSPKKATVDMAMERDNDAERLARIEKLMAETKPTPGGKPTTRLRAPQQLATQTRVPPLAVDRRLSHS